MKHLTMAFGHFAMTLVAALLSVVGIVVSSPKGAFVGRRRTHDVAFGYRMGSSFPGEVNRTHPASIEPAMIHASTPPTEFGEPVVYDTASNTVRALAATDTALTDVDGIVVRPYPTQPSSGTNYGEASFGATALPSGMKLVDIAKSAYIMGKLNTGTAAKGGAVYVWIAADSGSHIQNRYETAASVGNTILLTNAKFNGPADADGNVEIIFRNP